MRVLTLFIRNQQGRIKAGVADRQNNSETHSEALARVDKVAGVLGGDLNETLNTDVLSPVTDAPDLFTLT